MFLPWVTHGEIKEERERERLRERVRMGVHERWSLVSLVIVGWVDRKGRMSKAKRKQREPLPGVAMLVRSELERVLKIFGYLCVIGLQNERKSPVLVF